MREPKFIKLYRKVENLSEMSTEDLLQTIKYHAERSDFEDPKEAAVELDRRLGWSRLRERIGDVNNAVSSLHDEIRRAKANPTISTIPVTLPTYKTHDFCEVCRKWYPKGTHIPQSETCRA